jgi:hypothetical protein
VRERTILAAKESMRYGTTQYKTIAERMNLTKRNTLMHSKDNDLIHVWKNTQNENIESDELLIKFSSLT